jgi:hypothetical protein
MTAARQAVVEVLALPSGEATRAEQRALAEAAVADRAGRLTRICPWCGSTDHGQPRVAEGHVSLAYCAGFVVVALADAPVGVDVEVAGVAPAGFADIGAWTRAEAVLKATGEAMRRDPGTAEAVDAWTGPLDLPAPYVGWLAVLGVEDVSRRAAPAAAVRRATAPGRR